MKLTRNQLTTLTYKEEQLPMNAFFELMETSDKLLFEKGIYKNGPTVIETSLSRFGEPGESTFIIYIPTNIPTEIPIEGEKGFQYMEELTIEGLSEVTPFDENLLPTIEKLKEEAVKEELELIEDKLFLVVMPVFGRIFVEVILPIKEEV